MENQDIWKPGKYEIRNDRLRASKNTEHLAISSRLCADLIAEFYDGAIRKYCTGRVADLGCGKAPLFALYRNFSTDIICVDWPHTYHKNKHLDFECDLNNPLPFQANHFDTIILSDVLEHIREPMQLWKEMFRVLSPGGKILLNTPFLYWVHEHPFDYFRYTEFALRDSAEKTGFHVLELNAMGGCSEVLADLLAKRVVRFRLMGRPLAMFVQNICLWFSKRRSRKDATELFPLGYSMVLEK